MACLLVAWVGGSLRGAFGYSYCGYHHGLRDTSASTRVLVPAVG